MRSRSSRVVRRIFSTVLILKGSMMVFIRMSPCSDCVQSLTAARPADVALALGSRYKTPAQERKRVVQMERNQGPAMRLSGIDIKGVRNPCFRQHPIQRLDPHVQVDSLVIPV